MLTSKQIKQLRTLAHPLNFILQTGGKGLTEAIQKEIAIALKAHELIKVKLNNERNEHDEMIAKILQYHQCELVQYIGKTLILFKKNKKTGKITLIR